jgi:hypothetical protein
MIDLCDAKEASIPKSQPPSSPAPRRGTDGTRNAQGRHAIEKAGFPGLFNPIRPLQKRIAFLK